MNGGFSRPTVPIYQWVIYFPATTFLFIPSLVMQKNRYWTSRLAGLVCLCACLHAPAAENAAVYRSKVTPHWFADNTRFWYRVAVGRNAYEFVVVDVEKGSRRPAFDHRKLAEALARAGVADCRPEALPLNDLEFEPSGDTIRFRAGRKGWRCELANYQLHEHSITNRAAQTALSPDQAPRASRRTGEETSLRFKNRTGAAVQLFWVDTQGERQSYGRLAAGESREQHTYAGHLWLVTDATGKALAAFEADEAGGEVEITGETPNSLRPRQPAPPPSAPSRGN
jgi:dipeptidyl-peptidase 4